MATTFSTYSGVSVIATGLPSSYSQPVPATQPCGKQNSHGVSAIQPAPLQTWQRCIAIVGPRMAAFWRPPHTSPRYLAAVCCARESWQSRQSPRCLGKAGSSLAGSGSHQGARQPSPHSS